jgi:hypothetical protein
MHVIRPHCRAQFSAADIDFIRSVFARPDEPDPGLVRFLSDPGGLDELLDSDRLFRAILELADCVAVSSRLYFYVLVRRVLKETGIDNRVVADYVAELLARFSSMPQVRQPLPPDQRPLDYLVDMVAALARANDHEKFFLHVHMGNFSLFLAGIFRRHIDFRAGRRGAPGVDYYEGFGRAGFREAGSHPLARRYDLAGTLHALSDAFHETRLALNDMAERLVWVGEGETAPDLLGG